MAINVRGKIHGKTIELDSELGIPDGVEVDVTVTVSPKPTDWGEGIKRSAGIAADVPEFGEAMNQIAAERKSSKFRESNA